MSEFGPSVSLNNRAFIHPTALIYGNVFIGEGASLWPYAVIRSEMHEVRIGKRTNIQDFVMIHVGNRTPTPHRRQLFDHTSLHYPWCANRR